MANKRRINVIIDGRNFTIVGSEDESYIKDLANYVDKMIKSLASKNDRLSQTMSATLAALHIADELYKTNEAYEELEEKSREPLEKYDDLCSKLREAEMKIESYERICADYQETILDHTSQREDVWKEVDKYKDLVETRDKTIEEMEKQIKGLKDKNYENQIELIEIKKELAEYLKLLEAETSTN